MLSARAGSTSASAAPQQVTAGTEGKAASQHPGNTVPPEQGGVPGSGTALPLCAHSPDAPRHRGDRALWRRVPHATGLSPPSPPSRLASMGGPAGANSGSPRSLAPPRAPAAAEARAAFTNQCNSSSFDGVTLTRSNTLQRVCYSTSVSSERDVGPEIVSSWKRRRSAPSQRPLQPPTSEVPHGSLLTACTPVFQGARGCRGAPSCGSTQAPAVAAQAPPQP